MSLNVLITLFAASIIALIVVIDSSRGEESDRPWCRIAGDKPAFSR